MQKLLIGILGVGTVALAIVCVLQTRQLRLSHEQVRAVEAARATEADLQQAQTTRVKELERANRQLEQQVKRFADVTTTLRTSEARQSSNAVAWAEQARAAKQSGAGGGEGDGLFGKDMGDMLGKMMKDPAMREMMREQQKAAINMMYSGLFKEMKLSPEEKDKFKALLTDGQMRTIESAQGMFGDQKEGAAEQTQKLVAEAKKQSDADMKALLGDERFAQYQDYQKNISERMQMDQLKSRLEAENLPLQDQQTAQLLQIMKEEKAAVPPIIPTDNTEMPRKELMTAENLDKQIAWMDDFNRRVLDRAGQVLTPEQLKQYREFQDQQASMQKLGLNMARQMFGSGKGAPPPTAK